jgi:hypothetical protein
MSDSFQGLLRGYSARNRGSEYPHLLENASLHNMKWKRGRTPFSTLGSTRRITGWDAGIQYIRKAPPRGREWLNSPMAWIPESALFDFDTSILRCLKNKKVFPHRS